MSRPLVRLNDLGVAAYSRTWGYQTEIHERLKKSKLTHRSEQVNNDQHVLIMCEHHHVYTLGKTGSKDNLLLSSSQLAGKNLEFFEINRGGDITYHGPGQLVVYPILDLECFYRDVHRYVRELEEVVIRTIGDYGLRGIRKEGYTGVWLAPDRDKQMHRKICAIGVHLSRWVSLHGLALNVTTDLNMFNHIIPCGIAEQDKTITSIEQELSKQVDMTLVKRHFIRHFEDVFGCQVANQSLASS